MRVQTNTRTNFAVIANRREGMVHVFDRHGRRVDELSLQGYGPVTCLAWDADGECLAVLQEGSGIIPIWDSSTRTTFNVDTNLKDPSFMIWSKVGPQLAVGTAKGNFLMYNKKTRKKIPVLGKHPRRIMCGAWNPSKKLVLGSADSTITVSNDMGDTLGQSQLKRVPTNLCFVERSSRGRPSEHGDGNNVVAVNLSGKSLLLYNVDDPDRPMELAFQPKYGSIVVHLPFGDGTLLVGFSEVRDIISQYVFIHVVLLERSATHGARVQVTGTQTTDRCTHTVGHTRCM